MLRVLLIMMAMSVSSSAFHEGGMIPAKYTCDGQDMSPLNWAGISEGTKGIALTGDDPDAHVGTWGRWVMWNTPPSVHELAESAPPKPRLPDGSRRGISDFRSPGYGGPRPTSGTHRHYFKIYALRTMLDLPNSARKTDLLKAMKEHVIAEGQSVGRYRRE